MDTHELRVELDHQWEELAKDLWYVGGVLADAKKNDFTILPPRMTAFIHNGLLQRFAELVGEDFVQEFMSNLRQELDDLNLHRYGKFQATWNVGDKPFEFSIRLLGNVALVS